MFLVYSIFDLVLAQKLNLIGIEIRKVIIVLKILNPNPQEVDCKVVHTSDKCSSLPQVPNLQSDTQFPVSHGDVVKVFCEDSFNLVGDESITCNKDTDFTFSAQPTCVLSKYFYY